MKVASRNVYQQGRFGPACVVVREGRIVEMEDYGPADYDFGDLYLLPGVIDTHVHINEPGRTEWEGFDTATRAAAAGGITTLVDMPLNCIPSTTNLAALWVKQVAAKPQIFVDVGFWGGAVPGCLEQLEPLHHAGVLGFKCFLSHPGTDEFQQLTLTELEPVMRKLAQLETPLLVHAEDPECLRPFQGDSALYATYLATRPAQAEVRAIEAVAQLAEATGCRTHIVHVATEQALAVLSRSPLTCETCPHYLFFAAEEVAKGDTRFQCAPPIRSGTTREALWRALQEGQIPMVASDHSPSPAALKSDDFKTSWGGISSLQLLLPVVWSGARQRGLPLERVVDWLCRFPAQLAGLPDKGDLASGFRADLVAFSPERRFTVERLFHRHQLTPYQGRTLFGVVEATFLGGEKVFERGNVVGPPRGRLVKKHAGVG